jgi:signal transduction histidine kinase
MLCWRRLLLLPAALAASAAEPPAGSAPAENDPAASSSTASSALRAELETAERHHRAHYIAANYVEAIAVARAGLARATSAGTLRDQVSFLRHLAYDHWIAGVSDVALDYAHRVVEAGESLDDPGIRSPGHRYLSIIHHNLGDFDRARTHALAAQAEARRTADPRLAVFALEALAACDLQAGDFAAAERGFAEVRAFWQQRDFAWNAANSLFDLARVSEARGAFTGALATYREVLAARISFNDRRGQVRASRAIAGVLRRLGRAAEAAAELERVEALALEIGGHQVLAEYHAERALVHEALGDFARALAAERLADTARDALAGERARVRSAEISARLDLVQKERAIAELKRDRTLHAAVTLAVVTALAVAGVLLYFRWRQTRRLHAVEAAARVAAERADAFKSRFLAIASHDLRAPLASFETATEMIQESAHDPAAVIDLAGALRGEASRMSGLVRDFLDVTALESGRFELRPTTVDLAALAAAAVAERQIVAQRKRQTLALVAPAAPPPPIVADPERLRQVIENLVGNALKFTPAGGRIEVRPAFRAGHAVLEVSDNGPGLTPEDVKSLFVPFARLSARPTGGEPSTGLGLSIAREIIALHGGQLSATSTPGAGATFTIDLPVEKESA